MYILYKYYIYYHNKVIWCSVSWQMDISRSQDKIQDAYIMWSGGLETSNKWDLVGLKFNGPVYTINVMRSQSVQHYYGYVKLVSIINYIFPGQALSSKQ